MGADVKDGRAFVVDLIVATLEDVVELSPVDPQRRTREEDRTRWEMERECFPERSPFQKCEAE